MGYTAHKKIALRASRDVRLSDLSTGQIDRAVEVVLDAMEERCPACSRRITRREQRSQVQREQDVIAALEDGLRTTKTIADRVGLSRKYTCHLLSRLRDAEVVRIPKKGRWELV